MTSCIVQIPDTEYINNPELFDDEITTLIEKMYESCLIPAYLHAVQDCYDYSTIESFLSHPEVTKAHIYCENCLQTLYTRAQKLEQKSDEHFTSSIEQGIENVHEDTEIGNETFGFGLFYIAPNFVFDTNNQCFIAKPDIEIDNLNQIKEYRNLEPLFVAQLLFRDLKLFDTASKDFTEVLMYAHPYIVKRGFDYTLNTEELTDTTYSNNNARESMQQTPVLDNPKKPNITDEVSIAHFRGEIGRANFETNIHRAFTIYFNGEVKGRLVVYIQSYLSILHTKLQNEPNPNVSSIIEDLKLYNILESIETILGDVYSSIINQVSMFKYSEKQIAGLYSERLADVLFDLILDVKINNSDSLPVLNQYEIEFHPKPEEQENGYSITIDSSIKLVDLQTEDVADILSYCESITTSISELGFSPKSTSSKKVAKALDVFIQVSREYCEIMNSSLQEVTDAYDELHSLYEGLMCIEKDANHPCHDQFEQLKIQKVMQATQQDSQGVSLYELLNELQIQVIKNL